MIENVKQLTATTGAGRIPDAAAVVEEWLLFFTCGSRLLPYSILISGGLPTHERQRSTYELLRTQPVEGCRPRKRPAPVGTAQLVPRSQITLDRASGQLQYAFRRASTANSHLGALPRPAEHVVSKGADVYDGRAAAANLPRNQT